MTHILVVKVNNIKISKYVYYRSQIVMNRIMKHDSSTAFKDCQGRLKSTKWISEENFIQNKY